MKRSTYARTILAVAALATLISVNAEAARVELDRIAIIVDDDIITQRELDREIQVVRQQLRGQNISMPPAEIMAKQVAERTVSKKLQLQFAKNTGIFVDDNRLNEVVNRIATSNKLSLRELRNQIEAEGSDFESFREDLRQQIIINDLQQREIQRRVIVTDREIENFLTTQYAQGNVDDEYRLATLLVALPEAASPEQIAEKRQRADDIKTKIAGGQDFQQLAISMSDGQHALQGGDLGWKKVGELPSLFAEHILRMSPGDTSDVIRSSAGFYLIKMLDKRIGIKHIVKQTHARHILVQTNELVSRLDAVTRLEQIRERILNGEDFDALARAHSSDHASATRGGDLGWVAPGTMVPEFEAAMNALAPGKMSEPFSTQFGWHLVQVLDRRELDDSEEFRRNKAREFIFQRKMEENLEAWLRQLRDEAFVDYKIDI